MNTANFKQLLNTKGNPGDLLKAYGQRELKNLPKSMTLGTGLGAVASAIKNVIKNPTKPTSKVLPKAIKNKKSAKKYKKSKFIKSKRSSFELNNPFDKKQPKPKVQVIRDKSGIPLRTRPVIGLKRKKKASRGR